MPAARGTRYNYTENSGRLEAAAAGLTSVGLERGLLQADDGPERAVGVEHVVVGRGDGDVMLEVLDVHHPWVDLQPAA